VAASKDGLSLSNSPKTSQEAAAVADSVAATIVVAVVVDMEEAGIGIEFWLAKKYQQKSRWKSAAF
jgi:hypothetical protein